MTVSWYLRAMTDWMKSGACASGEYDADDWFPEGSGPATKRAKAVCNSVCPVRDACREYAVNFPVVLTGVWGGLSKRQVRDERMRRGLTVLSEADFNLLPKEWSKAPQVSGELWTAVHELRVMSSR